MRVAVFSDVHGNLAGLEAVLAELDRLGPFDRRICAGDVALFGPSPGEAVDRLREPGIETVRGNTDDYVARPSDAPEGVRAHVAWCRERLAPAQLEWLASLPPAVRLSPAPGADLLVVHASPRTPHEDVRLCAPGLPAAEARSVFGASGARVVAFGHRHGGFVALYGDLTLVNVSAVSITPDGRPAAAFAVLTWHGDHWTVEPHRVAYDPSPELERARQRGMPAHAWWQALARGR